MPWEATRRHGRLLTLSTDTVRGSVREVRLRVVWLFLLPFYFWAVPTPQGLVLGTGLGVLGLGLRAWAAGSIRKYRELATGGPYAYTRNPLYLGSFILGVGLTVAGGRWLFFVLLMAFFLSIYRTTALREAVELKELFGEAYETYAAGVPLFLPRVTAFRADGGQSGSSGFSWARYRRNREWEATLGGVAGFGFLAVRMMLWG